MQLLIQRNFAQAERALQRIKNEIPSTQWHKGYYNALEGLLLAAKSSDKRYLYVKKINPEGNEKIDKLYKGFIKLSKAPLQGDFDKGFFTVWAEYLKTLKLKIA